MLSLSYRFAVQQGPGDTVRTAPGVCRYPAVPCQSPFTTAKLPLRTTCKQEKLSKILLLCEESTQRPPSRQRDPTQFSGLEEVCFPRKVNGWLGRDMPHRPETQKKPEEGRPGTSTAQRPQTNVSCKQHEIPLIITQEDNSQRRVFSAHKGHRITLLKRPVSNRSKKVAFQTSLDPEFLQLFE